MRATIFLFILLALLLCGCAAAAPQGNDPPPSTDQSAVIHVTGRVVYVPLEGGFFGILASDGRKFDPLELPEEFRHDGLAVRATLRPAQGVVGYRMWGTIVEVVSIEKNRDTLR